jgi:[acyl-carrier-protein] S-malonyltransferase
MFPGQSSRYPEMLHRVVQAFPPAKKIVDLASDVLGRNLIEIYESGESVFDRNRDVQVGVFLASHLYLKVLEDNGVEASSSLGLSLGEYNHLVHIEAIDFADALVLVNARGQVYDEGPRGMMAALFPIEADEVHELVTQASGSGCVQVANYNTPSQFVVAGETRAVLAAMRLAEEEYSIDPVVIEKQIPMHTMVFRSVSEALLPHLKAAKFRKPKRPYVSNVLGKVVENAEPERIIELLAQHVYSPVLWRQAIDDIVERQPDSVFVEVGPRGILYNMLQKRWHPNAKFKTDVIDDLKANIGTIRANDRNPVREARI